MRKTSEAISEIFREGTLIDEAILKATKTAIRDLQHAGLPVIRWIDGKVVKVPSDTIDVDAIKFNYGNDNAE